MAHKRMLVGVAALVFLLGGENVSSAQTRSEEEKLNILIEKLSTLEKRIEQIETRLSAAPDSAAASTSSETATQLESLDQQIRIAERRRELAQEDFVARTAATPVVTADANGFGLQSNNGDYRLLFGMVAQTDGRFSLDDPQPFTSTFTIRKLRPTFSGRAARYFDFKVMPDFGNGTTVLQDAYFDIRFSPKFRVRAGKDKTPIGYELLQGDAFLLFPERALASSLVPNRDIGVQAQGDLAGGKVLYAGGVFNGIPDGSSTSSELDVNASKDLAGRVVFQPFRGTAPLPGPWSGFGFQVGGSTGRQGGALPNFRTSSGQTYFSYDAATVANGDRRRLSPAVFYYYKSFGAFAEYIQSTQSVARSLVASRVTNRGWEVSGSWLLTGEPASERGVRPKNNFDPAERRWGALQLVGRYTELTADQDTFDLNLAAPTASRQAQSFTVGANWYPAGFIKEYITFERTTFEGPVPRPAENVILVRSQLAF